MNVGIKYCGGCNCRYNRTQAVNNFIKNHPHYTYIYDPETQYCDICLVICGCPTACPEVTALLTKQVKFITSPHQLNTLDLSIDSLEKKLPPTSIPIFLHQTYTQSYPLTWKQLQDYHAFNNTLIGKTTPIMRENPMIPKAIFIMLITQTLQSLYPHPELQTVKQTLSFYLSMKVPQTIKITLQLQSLLEKERQYSGLLSCTGYTNTDVPLLRGHIRCHFPKNIFIYKSEVLL
ncbi:hypothetical protein [Megasphaera hutchinsoni]|uniref:Uncharacterized protein n=1 Tax=Megasphaera hutchinsoni TaxID=1588748 RepID=A0A134CJM9_9FIRM|nr:MULTISPECIES: hypothetical protein [Megasphaera]KXB92337.1 hypothetical protein HMPREF3182_00454 [Megasphaera hutchinsoni]PNH21057.1 hypothetical protein CAL30_06425 [Megasphaera genomosp. type_2]